LAVPHLEMMVKRTGTQFPDEFYSSIVKLDVEDNADSAGTFNLRLGFVRDERGNWIFPAEQYLQLFENISISARFESGNKVNLIDAYVTSVNVHIDSSEKESFIEIQGMDSTILMNLEEKEVSWVGKSDSEIAEIIFKQYQFIPKVKPTIKPPREEEHTVIQRGTDIEFLKKLAYRNGYECYVEKTSPEGNPTGFFQSPKVDETPQGKLYLHFDEKTNLVSLDIATDGIRPISAELKQKNAISNETIINQNDKSEIIKLGKTNLAQLFKDKMGNKPLPKILLSRHGTDNKYEIEQIVNSVIDDGSWFIKAKGLVNATKYASILVAKKLVEIYGAGDTYSGRYYITKVIHRFTSESYVQEFEAKRNALRI